MNRRSGARRRAGPGRIALLLSGVLLTGSVVACGDDDGTTLDPPSSAVGAGPTTTTAVPTTTVGGGAGAVPATAAPGTPVPTTATPATAGPQDIVVRLVDGRPEGGVRRQQVARGERVRIAITSDRADKAHLHGYDLNVDLPAGQTAALELVADVPGVFELETHETPRTILELEVR